MSSLYLPDAVCAGNKLWDGVEWKCVVGSLMCYVYATCPRTCTSLLVGVYSLALGYVGSDCILSVADSSFDGTGLHWERSGYFN